jgi:hypothetical protein
MAINHVSKITKFLIRRWWIIVTFLIIVISLATTLLIIRHNHQVEEAKLTELAQQKYQADLTQLKTIDNEYFVVFRADISLPSTTTKTESEWDDYYDGLISQLLPIITSINNNTFQDSRLTQAYDSLSTAVNDLNNYLSLSKSMSDMQFQVGTDQSKLNSDQSTLASEESIYNEADGLISNSYVIEFQTDVSNDKSQLATDQQTYQSQQTQTKTLAQTVIDDSLAVTKYTNILGL